MAKKVEKLFTVQCAYCDKEFPKLIKIIEGSEDRETEQQAYCPWCKKMVSFTIQGEPTEVILIRKLKNQ